MTRKAGSSSCAAIYHFQETESSMHRNEVASPRSAHSPPCAVERPHRRLSGYSRIPAQTALPERTSNAIVRRQCLAVHPAVLKAPGCGWRAPRSERAGSIDSAATSQTPRQSPEPIHGETSNNPIDFGSATIDAALASGRTVKFERTDGKRHDGSRSSEVRCIVSAGPSRSPLPREVPFPPIRHMGAFLR